LQTGLINTVAVPPVGAIALQWHTQLKYVFDLPLLYVYGLMTVRDRQFDRLEEADQLVVREVMGEVVRKVNAQNRVDHERAVEVLKNQGLAFTQPTPDESRRWKDLSDQATRDMIDQGAMSAELIDTLNDMLTEYRDSLD
jgi:TRAP-type C4-dicarboxylate transport system substrate-binding protein